MQQKCTHSGSHHDNADVLPPCAGDDAKGIGGGTSQSHADGEDNAVVVRLYCQLEGKVEQGGDETDAGY